jgi:acyl carrier protein
MRTMTISEAMSVEELELARLIVNTLNLEINLSEVASSTPLYAEGFGLDSIDILELALAISQKFGVTLHADDENNVEIFKSLQTLSEYIQERKTK